VCARRQPSPQPCRPRPSPEPFNGQHLVGSRLPLSQHLHAGKGIGLDATTRELARRPAEYRRTCGRLRRRGVGALPCPMEERGGGERGPLRGVRWPPCGVSTASSSRTAASVWCAGRRLRRPGHGELRDCPTTERSGTDRPRRARDRRPPPATRMARPRRARGRPGRRRGRSREGRRRRKAASGAGAVAPTRGRGGEVRRRAAARGSRQGGLHLP
jgi:hypothetical protein